MYVWRFRAILIGVPPSSVKETTTSTVLDFFFNLKFTLGAFFTSVCPMNDVQKQR